MKHERLRRHGQHDRDEEFAAVLPGRPWPGWSRSANHPTAALGELIDWQRVSHHERADKVRADSVRNLICFRASPGAKFALRDFSGFVLFRLMRRELVIPRSHPNAGRFSLDDSGSPCPAGLLPSPISYRLDVRPLRAQHALGRPVRRFEEAKDTLHRPVDAGLLVALPL